MGFASIDEAIEDVRAGRMLILVDDEDRENEGDLLVAAERITPEAVNFMATHGRGLICVPMTAARLEELNLPLMVPEGDALHGTAYTVAVDAKRGTTTGISSHDRYVTVKALVDPETRPSDLSRPGHVFPLRAREGGVLRRAGHTEAAVDLARMAGLQPAGVICEILNEDGSMARVRDLEKMAAEYGLKIVTIADLIEYRRRTEKLVQRLAESTLPTIFGNFKCIAFVSLVDEAQYLALVKGDVTTDEPVLVRVDSGCLTGHVFGSLKCDCRWQLEQAMKMIEEAGRGVVLYIQDQEGRGIGICNKIRAYELQDNGYDTVEANELLGFKADERDYGMGAQVLADLGVRSMRLLTNNPAKYTALEGYGLKVVERVPLETKPTATNLRYLKTKREKMGHLLTLGDSEEEPRTGAETTAAEPTGSAEGPKEG